MNFLYGTDEGEEIYPLNKEDESIERKYRIEHLKDYIALCQGEIEAYQSCLDNSIKEIKTLEREEELDKIERFEKLEPLF